MIAQAPVPPHDERLERLALAGVMVGGRHADAVFGMLTPADFYHTEHRAMFSRALELYKSGRGAPDWPTLRASMGEAFPIAEAEAAAHERPALRSLSGHCRALQELAEAGRVQAAAWQALRLTNNWTGDIEAIREAAASVAGATHTGCGEEITLDPRLAERVLEGVLSPDPAATVSTGVATLNDCLGGGWRCGGLYSLVGRPKTGKSALALHASLSACRAGMPVLLASLEMAAPEVLRRALAWLAEVGFGSNQELTPDEKRRLRGASAELGTLPMTIIDRPLTAPALVARARAMNAQGRCGLLVVDYLQLLRPVDRRLRQHETLTDACRELKGCASALGIPVLLAVQALSKTGESLRASDTKGSSAPLEDSDGVLLISRTLSGPLEVELNLTLHRHGPPAKTSAGVDFATCRFLG